MSEPGDMDEIPVTSMEEASAMLHELYITLQRAGFSPPEAMHLVSNVLGAVINTFMQSSMERKGS